MPGTFNAATGIPIVLLFFFVIPAVWIVGLIRIGSQPRRLEFWTLPFVLIYVGLVVAVRVFGWLAQPYATEPFSASLPRFLHAPNVA